MKDELAGEEIEHLKEKVVALSEENKFLKERLSFLEGHPTFALGLRGEQLLYDMIGGKLTSHTESHDLETTSGETLEIKMAKLNTAVAGSSTKRWAWGKVLGERGEKRFDYLVLVGPSDERYRSHYADPTSPYVFFLIPYSEVASFVTPTAKSHGIFLTTNPLQGRSKAYAMFAKYQVTAAQLRDRFGL